MSDNKIQSYVIFTTQRTGSTWLCDILHSHKSIKSYTELFRINPDADFPRYASTDMKLFEHFAKSSSFLKRTFLKEHLYKEYFTELFSMARSSPKCRSAGFKLMYSQEKRNRGLWGYLSQNTDKIIHLKRKNLLNRAISKVYMESTGIAHANEVASGDTSKPKGSLDIEKVLDELKKDISESSSFSKKITALPPERVITIYYEDLIENLDITLKKLYNFLEVPFHHYSSNFKKLSNEQPEDYVLNYHVLKAAAIENKLIANF